MPASPSPEGDGPAAGRTAPGPAGGAPPAAVLPTGLRGLLRAADLLAMAMAYASGAVFLLVSFYITVDVIGRKFFHVSTAVSDEIGGYALALGGMWALAYALRTGGHVRIDVLLPHLPPRLQSLLNYGAMATMALFAWMLAVYAWRLALDSFAMNAKAMSFIQTPIFLPQSLMAFGFTVLGVQAVLLLLVGVVQSLRLGTLATLEISQGPRSQEKA